MITLDITVTSAAVELDIQLNAAIVDSGGDHDLEFGSDSLMG
jgi:hypothetical protein